MSLSARDNSIRGRSKNSERIRDICIFSMLGAVMFCSKILMEILPNIHLLGMLTAVYTVAFRKKALIPLYIYVMLNGLYSGFAFWWIPYLYIWTLLWAMVMLIPRKITKKIAAVIYPVICSIHGFLFGILYAPVQALLYGFNFKQTLAWIAAGFSFDIIHGISNFALGFSIIPLSDLLIRLYNRRIK